MFVKDACEPVDSPGERGDCPDLGCGDSAGSVYLAGGQHFEWLRRWRRRLPVLAASLGVLLSGGLTPGA
jgi:hypothetical protein